MSRILHPRFVQIGQNEKVSPYGAALAIDINGMTILGRQNGEEWGDKQIDLWQERVALSLPSDAKSWANGDYIFVHIPYPFSVHPLELAQEIVKASLPMTVCIGVSIHPEVNINGLSISRLMEAKGKTKLPRPSQINDRIPVETEAMNPVMSLILSFNAK